MVQIVGSGTGNYANTAIVDNTADPQHGRLWTNSFTDAGSAALGVVSLGNSTNTPLISNGSFVGPWEEVKNYSMIYVSARTDQPSANTGTFGFNLEFSQDAGSGGVDVMEEYFLSSGTTGAIYSTQPSCQWFRINYINDTTQQGLFRLQTLFRPNYGKPSSHRIDEPISAQNDAELVKSVLTGQKPNGDFINFQGTTQGNFKISLEEYDDSFIGNPLPVREPLLSIAREVVTGMSSVNKFGRNIEIDSSATADIWDGGHTVSQGGVSLIWVAPTQARIHSIVSTSDNDSDTGGINPQSDGARTIRIFGLTDWDTNEVNEDVIMDGTNSVNTSNSYVIIHRILVLTKGNNSAGPNVGIITATAATDGTITAQIRVSQGQTQMAIYGVPSTQKAYIGRLYANVNKSAGAAGLLDVSLLSNPEPDNEITNFLTKHTFGLQTVGTSAFTIPYYAPKVIDGPAIIKIQASSNTNDMDVSAGFDLVLVDN